MFSLFFSRFSIICEYTVSSVKYDIWKNPINQIPINHFDIGRHAKHFSVITVRRSDTQCAFELVIWCLTEMWREFRVQGSCEIDNSQYVV